MKLEEFAMIRIVKESCMIQLSILVNNIIKIIINNNNKIIGE